MKSIVKIVQAFPGMPMTEDEVQKFLENSKLIIQLATSEEDGCPTIQPAWFLYDKDAGKIYVGTQKTSKKVQNMQRNPDKTYFSIDDESFPYKGVKGKAVASIS
ncbi:MAG: pyridoxamine 5'-phosphate oxidase family protein [Nitrososphaeraceae archaeon]